MPAHPSPAPRPAHRRDGGLRGRLDHRPASRAGPTHRRPHGTPPWRPVREREHDYGRTAQPNGGHPDSAARKAAGTPVASNAGGALFAWPEGGVRMAAGETASSGCGQTTAECTEAQHPPGRGGRRRAPRLPRLRQRHRAGRGRTMRRERRPSAGQPLVREHRRPPRDSFRPGVAQPRGAPCRRGPSHGRPPADGPAVGSYLPLRARSNMPTLCEAFQDNMSSKSYRSAKTGDAYRRAIEHYLADWVSRPLNAIERREVEARFTLLTRNHGLALGNQVVSFLRSGLPGGCFQARAGRRGAVRRAPGAAQPAGHVRQQRRPVGGTHRRFVRRGGVLVRRPRGAVPPREYAPRQCRRVDSVCPVTIASPPLNEANSNCSNASVMRSRRSTTSRIVGSVRGPSVTASPPVPCWSRAPGCRSPGARGRSWCLRCAPPALPGRARRRGWP